MKETIQARLRHPGGQHEWLMVAEAPQFKRWGMTAEKIWSFRSEIRQIETINPIGGHAGSTGNELHRQLQKTIRGSSSYDDFIRQLNNWAQYRLPDGTLSLPIDLRK